MKVKPSVKPTYLSGLWTVYVTVARGCSITVQRPDRSRTIELLMGAPCPHDARMSPRAKHADLQTERHPQAFYFK